MSEISYTDVLSPAEARGKRLKILRKMADLSRRALTDKHKISASTIQAWEEGKAGGLTTKGAQRVILALRKEGIDCEIEWLLHGSGHPPQFSGRMFLNAAEPENMYQSASVSPADIGSIAQELLIFRQFNTDVLDMRINDDGMLPFYQPGDIIAGKRYYPPHLADVIGKDCIIETAAGEKLFRRLRQGEAPDRFHLQCIYLEAGVAKPFCYNVALVSAAPVLWHRRHEKNS